MRVTRNHVARKANVSATTVSNILNGKTELYNPRTIKSVREASKELGYTPNKIAKALKTGRSNIITIWVYDIAERNNAVILQNIQRILAEKCTELIVKDTKFIDVFSEEMSSDGIISVKSRKYLELYRKKTFYEIPIVSADTEKADFIYSDLIDCEKCRLLTDELFARIKKHLSE